MRGYNEMLWRGPLGPIHKYIPDKDKNGYLERCQDVKFCFEILEVAIQAISKIIWRMKLKYKLAYSSFHLKY